METRLQKMDISKMTNQYNLSKTLRFSLLPIGATSDNVRLDVLSNDQKRADEYGSVKKIIDRYHKQFIESSLIGFSFDEALLEQAAQKYYAEDFEGLSKLADSMMKQLSAHLTGQADFKQLFEDDMIKEIIPKSITDETEKKLVSDFSRFWTYFSGFNKNRKNIYSGEGKSTEIAYRVVKQNLPKFLDNLKTWNKLLSILPADEIADVDSIMNSAIHATSVNLFTVASFNRVISQSGIDAYNSYLGGYTDSDNNKIKGINEVINLYAQKTGMKLPKLKPLFKQILSDRESISFIPELYASDQEVINSIITYLGQISPSIEQLHTLIKHISEQDCAHIFIANNTDLTTLSNYVYGSWPAIRNAVGGDDENKKTKRQPKRISYSISELENAVNASTDLYQEIRIADAASQKEEYFYEALAEARDAAGSLLARPYPSDRNLKKDDESIQTIKTLLEALKDYQRFVLLFAGAGEESDKDEIFYGQYEEAIRSLNGINRLYDQVRNYATQKPFSAEKIRLMFNNSDFLTGWAQQTEWSGQEAHLFFKDRKYYLFITSHSLNENDWRIPLYSDIDFAPATRFCYSFQKTDNENVPRLFIRSKGSSYAPAVKEYNLPLDDVINIYDNEYFKANYRSIDSEKYKDSLRQLIDYFKICFARHKSYSEFEFNWKLSTEYDDISQFYRDAQIASYRLKKETVNFNGLLSMVEAGNGYLFEIYSKDFSPFSHGRPNLHTLYFKALFEESNTCNIRLQGGAQIYFRAASLKREETAVHPANIPLQNKNPLNPKSESTFTYELIKDKRYTQDHFELHMPIELNFTAPSSSNANRLNEAVRNLIADSDDIHLIGIDRGERNLLYVCVIDRNARIVEQYSLNVIEDEYDGGIRRTDYHDLLDKKERERQNERREWKAIEKIKDLKEGYLSQAVHRVCMLVEKYNALVIMENLNSGFKNARSAVEKSVYQKFEKMLCEKLSYLVNKQKAPTECGGYLNAYQLATSVTSYNDMKGQNGIIFYVPAWLTSKIDPATGFVDLLHPRYENIEKAKAFFEKFESVTYNAATDMFDFSIDLSKFPRTESSFKKNWIVSTNGDRVRTFRNERKNGKWECERINLTEHLIDLFNEYGIDYAFGDLRRAIIRQTEKVFFERLIRLFALTLQMRNSVTGTDEDYLISPVRNEYGAFYDSRTATPDLPRDADANGAYNIARKGLWIVNSIRAQRAEGKVKMKLSMDNAQWLKYAQTETAK